MPDLAPFQHYQCQFGRYLRDPQQPLPAGVAAERGEVYAELLFNNLRNFIDACCPVCRLIVGEPDWTELIRAFYIEHRCHSPLFRDIPREFVHWLLEHPQQTTHLPPFIAHLAHYEWLELAADVHPGEVTAPSPVDAPLTSTLHANPTLQLGIYPWPVQQISVEFQPLTPDTSPTCLAVYRDSADTVRFTQLNPLSAHLLSLLQAQPLTGQAALQQLATDAGMDWAQLLPFGEALLLQWLDEELMASSST
jgi:hypothetical protein